SPPTVALAVVATPTTPRPASPTTTPPLASPMTPVPPGTPAPTRPDPQARPRPPKPATAAKVPAPGIPEPDRHTWATWAHGSPPWAHDVAPRNECPPGSPSHAA